MHINRTNKTTKERKYLIIMEYTVTISSNIVWSQIGTLLMANTMLH